MAKHVTLFPFLFPNWSLWHTSAGPPKVQTTGKQPVIFERAAAHRAASGPAICRQTRPKTPGCRLIVDFAQMQTHYIARFSSQTATAHAEGGFMRYINCLNNISAKGTDLLGSDYQLTDDIAQASGVLVRSAAMHDHGPSRKPAGRRPRRRGCEQHPA